MDNRVVGLRSRKAERELRCVGIWDKGLVLPRKYPNALNVAQNFAPASAAGSVWATI